MTRPTSETTDDADLVALTRAGDSQGLGGLYDRYAARMLGVAARLTGSMADAEDVVHDVFVRLPTSLATYQHRGALGSWLVHVTARAALMQLRSARRRREDDLDATETVVMHQPAMDPGTRTDLDQAISRLPDGLRAVFVLRQIEGFTHDEIATLLDISVGASRVRHSRALEALRLALDPPVPDAAARRVSV